MSKNAALVSGTRLFEKDNVSITRYTRELKKGISTRFHGMFF